MIDLALQFTLMELFGAAIRRNLVSLLDMSTSFDMYFLKILTWIVYTIFFSFFLSDFMNRCFSLSYFCWNFYYCLLQSTFLFYLYIFFEYLKCCIYTNLNLSKSSSYFFTWHIQSVYVTPQCINIDFIVLWFICLSSSHVYFKKSPEKP